MNTLSSLQVSPAKPGISAAVRAVFLDKDGTLLENVPYNVDPNQMRFTEGALTALQLLHQANYVLIVITNQSGVARGYFPETALIEVEQHLYRQLAQVGILLRGFYYCPHHPDGVIPPYNVVCTCRKPQPGLLHQAAAEQGIDLTQSWFIGDILHDVEAGRAAGCRTILLDNGNETEWQLSQNRLPHHVVTDLREAAAIILALDAAPSLANSVYPAVAHSTCLFPLGGQP
ncbi:D-glycero-alpha-D-manno-heptose-1,7-bisphosphate 7-phosphatase [Leptolyngbya sp. 7M]|uniref:D-glycero-alpha-D-manno-heptose-1,7-bisphosphate 7-phosphatase n=1 Tax=Leptolyngbya sp. 7M TaxID=2812896 RepID=UPI001B8BFE0E|nr:HAD family hydrolase [Leptolyngbya sp. 7M]QYO62023.1 HAD family hydrolase [Leptolyngbya sp. 7M]